MAKRQVFEITCDRCKRAEVQPMTDQSKSQVPELEITHRGTKVVYQDLCIRCQEAVENYFASITKTVQQKAQPDKSSFLGLGKKT